MGSDNVREVGRYPWELEVLCDSDSIGTPFVMAAKVGSQALCPTSWATRS